MVSLKLKRTGPILFLAILVLLTACGVQNNPPADASQSGTKSVEATQAASSSAAQEA